MSKFSIKNPVLVNLVMMTAIVMGTVSLIDLPRTLMPDVNFHWVYVITNYEGVSPDEIEKLISIPIEDAVNNVDKIKMMTSTSSEGLSQISIQFENMGENEYQKLYQDLKSEIDAIDDLPGKDLIKGPNYLEFGSDDLMPMLFVIVSGTLQERDMIDIAKISGTTYSISNMLPEQNSAVPVTAKYGLRSIRKDSTVIILRSTEWSVVLQ